MNIYNLYFNLKDEADEERLLKLAAGFARTLVENGVIHDWSMDVVQNFANFNEMLKYHMAIVFTDSSSMESGFAIVREQYMNEHPHSELMKSVSEFKVTFCETVNA